MKYRKTFREAMNDVNRKSDSTKDDGDALAGDHGTIEDRLRMQIAQLKQQLENEKNKVVKPEPNPDTGEVPLRTGIAQAILDKNGPKPKVEKEKKEKVKLSSGQSKIEVNPDVPIGQISGGNKAHTGNLH